ncbi:MAG: 1-acyl-sn-glycerol-3-phosphate acyltransferase [Clostridia bacterium]|nr:1-acyl-sn-glycerol-3-phosphate acyltransferase [Clostridia bacterium]
MGRIFSGFVKLTAYPAELVCFRTKIHYEDKKEQGRKIKGAAILICNHTAVWDFAQLMQIFFGRHIRCLTADLMFKKNKAMNFLMTHLDMIKISRESKNFSFIEESLDVLNEGGVIEIYPESRILKPGEQFPLEFKPSAAYIALLSRAPVIPVYTDGNYFGKGRANVIIGKKIDVNTLIDEDADVSENIKRINDHMRNRIVELKNELEKRKEEKQRKKI